ncbi:uncharacterized protein si:dkey-28a3.2 isoform X2 [Melanotaenia boesemani]|uniref:uncharacterized protein si:dkey-28a3.2 isoform X2 n=1 Tax=Melanotaenia boesemani TaxID=1250792 RepID=UPI001C05E654|nr:uncharacterized protein si:dkey-28a3.2 isoform X2 [Melanotaenia boesemani]
MPAVKSKVGSMSHRYRPASEYDDATLAQKREYWRKKKREQRARLSERNGGTLPHLHVPVETLEKSPRSQIRNPGDEQEEEELLQTRKIKVSPQLQLVSDCILAKEAPESNGTQLDTSSSVPPVTRTTSSSSTLVPVSQSKAQAAPPVQPKFIAPDVTTVLASPCGHVSIKTEVRTPNTTAQRVTKRGANPTPRPGGVGASPASMESEEERAAKRREHWRIKKREQRAKLAARVAKARERTQSREVVLQRPEAGSGLLPALFVRGVAQKPSPIRVSVSIPSVSETRGGAAKLLAQRGTVQHPHGEKTAQTAAMLDASVQPAESQRKAPSYLHLCNLSRGIARCKTPRQRFIETQRSFMNQRSFRCKPPSMASVFGPRSLPRIHPGDTPEQIIAKRREYWRVKKREQRAKLSMETKAQLKEKDSLMRRVKRYQQILEEMRRARALARSAGSGLTHAGEAIGGFIKEDGTLTVNVLHSPKHQNTAGEAEELQVLPKSSRTSTQHRTNPRRSTVPVIRINQLPPPVRKTPRLLSIKPHPHPASTGPMAGSSGGVRKMALTLDPGLTEEEKMAKKREYWRVKKREQRAARAGVALQRRKAHKQAVAMETGFTGSTQPLNAAAIPPHGDGIKQEFEPAADLNSPAEPTICLDIKPPTSPPPLEHDPALSADSQATTLLAVASMKKLLEESLSTVTESRSQQTSIKTEVTEDAPGPDVKPSLPPVFFQKDVSPIAADLTLQIKSWHPDIEDTSGFDVKTLSKPLSASNEVVHSSPIPSTFKGNVAMETPDGPTSPRRTQRLCSKKIGHPSCCPPEPPRLHHIPSTTPDHQQEQQQSKKQPSGQRSCSMAPEQGGLSSLQRKREYWKMMKRQQRARVKARQKDRQGEGGGRFVSRNVQTPGLMTGPAKPPVSSVCGILVVSPTCSDQSADLVQVHLPPTSREDPPQNVTKSPQRFLERTPQSLEVDLAPSLPTLKPPDNPLASINLQPIESPSQSPTSILSPIKIPYVQLPILTSKMSSSIKPAPVSTLVPPKPIPGESQEDFLRRKREYWRIKKKEQRARKAVQDKGSSPGRSSGTWRPILPGQDPQTQRPAQDSGRWMSSSEESEHLMSLPVDSDPGPFPYSDYSAQVEDESALLFAEHEEDEDEEGPVSDIVWRNRYLMDYDPLNQLLVCMVCGELQYSHGLEGVRAHIDEAHPHTLTLEPGEKQRILEAWDEQVSQRERFFTSQLQQHSGTLTETNRN